MLRKLLKNRTIFTKLLITYLLAIIIMTAGIGISSYVMSARLYNEEIEQGSRVLLNQYKALIETKVLEPAEHTAAGLIGGRDLTLSLEQYFVPEVMDNRAVYSLHRNMEKYILDAAGSINDIHLLSPNKGLVLSSVKGLTILQTHDKIQENADWIWNADRWDSSDQWSFIDTGDGTVGCLRFLQRYPTVASEPARGFIAVDVNAGELSELLDGLNRYQDSRLVILDGSGSIIELSDRKNEPADPEIGGMDLESQGGGFLTGQGENACYFTYSSAFSNGWRLAMLTPVKEFYSSASRLQERLILIAFLCIVGGVAVSLLFSYRMYLPVKGIVSRLRRTDSGETRILNEYEFIDDAILHLNSTVSDLNGTLEQNRPLLEYNILASLLNRTLTDKFTWKQRLELIGLHPAGSFSSAIVIKLQNRLMDVLDEKNFQILKLNMMGQISECCSRSCIVSEYRYHEIVAMVFLEDADNTALAKKLEKLFENHPRGSIYIAAGTSRQDPADFSISYDEASEALKYSYFKPDKMCFLYTDYQTRGTQEDGELEEQIRKFYRQVHSREVDGAVKTMDDVRRIMAESFCRYSYLQQKLLDLIHVFAEYNKEVNLDAKFEVEDFEARFVDMDHADDFFDLFREMVVNSLSRSEQITEQKNENIINTVCDYIEKNLAEDLSLGRLSRMAGLSGGHLSRLFKEVTRQNIVDYITEKRMKEARTLILSTSLNIEEIAGRVGYMTPHYFCKKFKEAYGYTPKYYRTIQRNREMSEEK